MGLVVKFPQIEHGPNAGPKNFRGIRIGQFVCREVVEDYGAAVRCEAVERREGTMFALES